MSQTNIITLLKGSWPEWYGNLGDFPYHSFIYIRIRHGECLMGVGHSHADAAGRATVVREDESLHGVMDINDAIRELREQGYLVKSIIVPEHIEEIEHEAVG